MLSLPKVFREFLLTEIKGPGEVVVHMSFVHPIFGNKEHPIQQKIYFSKNLEYMIERLGYQDVYLYKRSDHGKDKDNKLNKGWHFLKHLSGFPAQE